MKVAEFVSDLTSLHVCDPSSALALVSAQSEGSTNTSTSTEREDDPDLKRTKDLVELHNTVKLAHESGANKELNDARFAVVKAIRDL